MLISSTTSFTTPGHAECALPASLGLEYVAIVHLIQWRPRKKRPSSLCGTQNSFDMIVFFAAVNFMGISLSAPTRIFFSKEINV